MSLPSVQELEEALHSYSVSLEELRDIRQSGSADTDEVAYACSVY